MKRTLATAAALLLLVGLLTACGGDKTVSGKHHVEIEIENYGTIAVELDADAAPVTVANFLKLAKEGFYDGLTFHRIIAPQRGELRQILPAGAADHASASSARYFSSRMSGV